VLLSAYKSTQRYKPEDQLDMVRFQVLTSMKMAVFWVVAPCSLVKFADVSEILAASITRAMKRQ
jgi:hypothetical protein